MRIPLDYYRILGLPIQATNDQLRQAHRDRTLQLPRREYSDAAIASRRKLLDEAYAVLSNPERRKTYDLGFLAKTYDLEPDAELGAGATDKLPPPGNTEAGVDPHTPSIEIQDEQLVGTLLVLQDLGEYELVLKLGRPFITGGNASLKGGQYGDPSIIYSDIVLTVALACLELGREQWQQGQYENAAEALETGQQLLLREGLFAGVRGEIQNDLYKLRPYRVLELLALTEDCTEERYRGMQLLQEMLQERDGIDGGGDDQSGLNIDDFLRFIQQLRGHLTAAEQQILFEQEAQRPSAVATYLAVYALLARGFADRQPVLIRRAKLLLMRLSSRQDVHLEQAVCALLLGQTEEASRALEISQEYGPIAFIREHSQGAPDLLPGLCLYAERWLQDEVFPHFRDLARLRSSLKEYFADPQVQSYLEELPNEMEPVNEWTLERSQAPAVAGQAASVGVASFSPPNPRAAAPDPAYANPGYTTSTGFAGGRETEEALIAAAQTRIAARTSTATMTPDRPLSDGTVPPAAERIGQPPTDAPTNRTQRGDRARNSGGSGRADGAVPLRRKADNEGGRQRSMAAASGAIGRFLLPVAVIVGMVALGFLVAWLLKSWQTAATKQSQQPEQPQVQLDVPLVILPEPVVTDPTTVATLTNESAEKLILLWLEAKAQAMGPDHITTKLEQILAEPRLSEWRATAEDAKQSGAHRKYKHAAKVTSVEQSKERPDQAKVTAEVSESTEYYKANQLEDSKSDPELRVQYDLVRVDDKWRVQNWQVIE